MDVRTTFERLSSAIAGARRTQLDELVQLVWRGHLAGELTDAQAQALAERAQAMRSGAAGPSPVLTLAEVVEAGPSGVAKPSPARPRRSVGSRPVTPESRMRCRMWQASGWMPARLAAKFTPAEQAVLAVYASEVAKRGDCRLCIDAVAALAGVSRSTVQAAVRQAKGCGLLVCMERRVTAWRNETNVVRIVSPEWLSWLRLRTKGGGCKTPNPTKYGSEKGPSERPVTDLAEGPRAAERGRAEPARPIGGRGGRDR